MSFNIKGAYKVFALNCLKITQEKTEEYRKDNEWVDTVEKLSNIILDLLKEEE